jgi:acetyl esterase/lipase
MKMIFKSFILLFIVYSFSFAQVKPDYKDVEYAVVDTSHLLLDIYLPKGVQKPYPTIVWIHGGAWMGGNKSGVGTSYLLNSGFAIVSINYRLSQEAIFPAQIWDCKGAIRWLRANALVYGFNPDKIGVAGSSAGGHLVALLGTSIGVQSLEGDIGGNTGYSSDVQSVADFYGPSNFLTIGSYPSTLDHNSPDSPESKLIGYPILDSVERAKAASPIFYVDGDDPPFLILHGTQDMTVPFHQSVELDSALRLFNQDVAFFPIEDAGHGGGGFNADSTRNTVIDFFNRTLKGTTNVDDIDVRDFSVYPNPASNYVEINVGAIHELPLRDICIYNMIGECVINQEIALSSETKIKIDISKLYPGVYFVRVGKVTKVFVKE